MKSTKLLRWVRDGDSIESELGISGTGKVELVEPLSTIVQRDKVRGSMPFMWEQIVYLTYKPKFEIVQPEEAGRIAERHFLDVRKKYGSVLAVDLVNKLGGERRLSERFADTMQACSTSLVRM